MAIQININEARLLQYHEDQRDEVYLQHFYPGAIGTKIPNYNITSDELAEMTVADATGRALVDDTLVGPKGTRSYRDKYYCNGIPRGRR